MTCMQVEVYNIGSVFYYTILHIFYIGLAHYASIPYSNHYYLIFIKVNISDYSFNIC